jgi:hypothetical protein
VDARAAKSPLAERGGGLVPNPVGRLLCRIPDSRRGAIGVVVVSVMVLAKAH